MKKHNNLPIKFNNIINYFDIYYILQNHPCFLISINFIITKDKTVVLYDIQHTIYHITYKKVCFLNHVKDFLLTFLFIQPKLEHETFVLKSNDFYC